MLQNGNCLMGKSLLYYDLFNEVSVHLNIYLISRWMVNNDLEGMLKEVIHL